MMVPRSCGIWSTSKAFVRLFADTAAAAGGLRPRRSVLYVPGDDIKKVEKSKGLNADCVVLDCEDGVAINRKAAARETIASFLKALDGQQSEYLVRLNPVQSGLTNDDVSTILGDAPHVQGIMLPKMEHKEDITKVQDMITKACGHRRKRPLVLIGMIETALGLLNMRSILETACNASSVLDCQSFVFGSDDFLASIGGTRTQDANELLYARQCFVTHCKAFNLQAIDMVYINFKDSDGLINQSEQGARMGFTGKQVIHPNQVGAVNNAFSPNEETVREAIEMIEAFEEHQKGGKGAFVFRGSMIDMPSIKQANNVLQLHRREKS